MWRLRVRTSCLMDWGVLLPEVHIQCIPDWAETITEDEL